MSVHNPQYLIPNVRQLLQHGTLVTSGAFNIFRAHLKSRPRAFILEESRPRFARIRGRFVELNTSLAAPNINTCNN